MQKEPYGTSPLEHLSTTKQPMRTMQRPKTKGWEPEFAVKTASRMRLGKIVIAANQNIAVAINSGYNGKMNLGYYTYYKGKRYNIRSKDVTLVARYE